MSSTSTRRTTDPQRAEAARRAAEMVPAQQARARRRLAGAAGADEDAVRPCVEDGEHADWVAPTTTQAGDQGVQGTPTVYVDGEELEEPAALGATVDAALWSCWGTLL